MALQGDLRGALKAYEESLTQDPDAEDAIANRDFIQSLLDQQEQEQQDQEGEQQDQEGEESEQSEDSQSESGDSSEPSDQEEQSNNNESGNESTEGQNNQDEQEQQSEQQNPNMADAEDINTEALEAATQEQMAKFDEALEEQQALEQWLRRVPDDPGGLLRRKFRYQTMQRLREGEEPDESIRW